MSNSKYRLVDRWEGKEFIQGNEKGEKWFFYSQNDPTEGCANYGHWKELIQADDDKIRIEVESYNYNPENGDRKAIRIQTADKKYNGGLFIGDIHHIPEGQATWAAFWLLGTPESAWPTRGECDIVEGINSTPSTNSRNLSVLHFEVDGNYRTHLRSLRRGCKPL